MSRYTENEIKSAAITIIDEFGEINTSELHVELRSRLQPEGDDLAPLKNRADDKFSQKVRNLVSHIKSNNSIALFVDVDTSVKPMIFKSRRVLAAISSLTPEAQRNALTEKKKRARTFTGRIIDYDKYNKEKSEIGRLGELFILEVEKKDVESNLGIDFVKHIIHKSVTEGDGLGYDILSYNAEGIKHVEVKTTKTGLKTSFYMTYNEKMFLDLHKETYYLIRVYEFNVTTKTGKYEVFRGDDIETTFDFETQSYRVKFR